MNNSTASAPSPVTLNGKPETTATALLARGFWPTVIYPGQKRPIGEAWGLKRITLDLICQRFKRNPGASVGICVGPGKGPKGEDIADIEVDGPAGEDSLLVLVGGLVVDTMSWASSRGAHRVFRVDARFFDLLAKCRAEEGKGEGKSGAFKLPILPDLEFRIGGKHEGGVPKQIQSVVPPSVGDDGKPREWIHQPESLADLPEAAYEFLEGLADRIAEREGIQGEQPNGVKHPSMYAKVTDSSPAGRLSAYGRKILEEEGDKLAALGAGGRHLGALPVSLRLASAVKSGLVGESECVTVFTESLRQAGLPADEIKDLIDSAMAKANPRKVIPDFGAKSGASAGTAAAAQNLEILDFQGLSDDELGLVPAESVVERPTSWQWEYRFADGELALIAGNGGEGKTQLLLAYAALITTGRELPDGSGKAPLGDVIILSAEDSRESTLKPRLMAMGADLKRVTFLTAKVTIKRPGKPSIVHPASLQDREYWKEVFRRRPDCRQFLVDPLPSYLGRGVRDDKNIELRQVLEPFIEEVLRPSRICMTATTHLNKNGDLKTIVHRIMGSVAYGAIPRNVHFVIGDKDNPPRRLFGQVK